jgi:hypothetical protein
MRANFESRGVAAKRLISSRVACFGMARQRILPFHRVKDRNRSGKLALTADASRRATILPFYFSGIDR